MGKRKRRVHRPPIAPLSPPDATPCSSRMKPLSSEKPANISSTRVEQSRSSAEDIMGSHEQQNVQLSVSHHHHHHNPGHSIYVKRSRNRGHHYPRHSQGYHYSAYHGKNNSSLDHHIVPFKVGNRWNSESGYNAEGRERAFTKPERIRSSNTAMEIIVPLDDEKMVCGTCERLLRQKHALGSSILNTEPSVVAVLVCGHVFHADCLEQRTSAEDASDPPCPLCSELVSKTEAA